MRKRYLRVGCARLPPGKNRMRRILLVKTSSLGDIVHNLPVASDIGKAFPQAEIDWIAEHAFAAVPRAHMNVKAVISVAVRRWRRAIWKAETWMEIRGFLRQIQSQRYDAVIDTQGLLKSALIARAAHGERYGLDWASSREPLRLFYSRTFSVPWSQHAVQRNRSLAAQALHYTPAPPVDYDIRPPARDFSWLPNDRYAVLIHSTSAEEKLWPEARWTELAHYFAARGIVCVLPWGSTTERERSERLARAVPGAIVPPALQLDEVMALLGGAYAVVGVDTGLTHLAAALGAATVGIYCATDPARTGVFGAARGLNVGGAGSTPEVSDVEQALARVAA